LNPGVFIPYLLSTDAADLTCYDRLKHKRQQSRTTTLIEDGSNPLIHTLIHLSDTIGSDILVSSLQISQGLVNVFDPCWQVCENSKSVDGSMGKPARIFARIAPVGSKHGPQLSEPGQFALETQVSVISVPVLHTL
jgi:hypothetical protein